MGVCVDKLPHSCGTRQGLQVFADPETGKVDGWCFSCNKYVAHPYGKPVGIEDVELPKEKTEEEIQLEILEVETYPVLDVPSRKLRGSSLGKFGARTSVSEEDGKTPTAIYYPATRNGKLSGYFIKTLSEPRHSWSIGDLKKADPFNWEQAKSSGAYRLIITEGPDDMVAVDRIYELHNNNKDYHPAIISLPRGAGSVKSSLGPIAQEISRLFRDVIICFDNDKVGEKAVQEAMHLIPKAKVAHLPSKDANDCLIEGKSKAAYKALAFDSGPPKNTRLILGQTLHEEARSPTPRGDLTWPFEKLDTLMRGIRYGETIYIGAGVKMGKSELLNSLAAHFIQHHGVKVLSVKPEEENKITWKLVCGKIVGENFVDPDRDFNYDKYDQAGKIIGDRLYLLDIYQHVGWESLKQDIVAAASLGVKVVFIDPITNLTNGMASGDANSKLQEIAQDLAALAKDLNIVVFVFCHLKAPEGVLGKEMRKKKYSEGVYHGLGNHPHEFGGDVLSTQFAGSRAMMRSCHLMLGLEGNKDLELPEKIRKMRWLTVLEDRNFGNTASIPIIYDSETTLYKGI